MFARLRAKRPGSSLFQLFFYEVIRDLSGVFLVVCFRARAFHAERIPGAGPLLLAANHQSYLDPPLIGGFIGNRQTTYVARLGLFKFKPLGWFISALNAIPLRENSGDAAAIREVIRRLEQGEVVLIFPEGTRTFDGTMLEFKRGVALLVKKAKCPIVPIAVEGAFEGWPRDRILPRLFRTRVGVLYGNPIPYDELMKDGAEAALQRIEREVAALKAELREKLARR